MNCFQSNRRDKFFLPILVIQMGVSLIFYLKCKFRWHEECVAMTCGFVVWSKFCDSCTAGESDWGSFHSFQTFFVFWWAVRTVCFWFLPKQGNDLDPAKGTWYFGIFVVLPVSFMCVVESLCHSPSICFDDKYFRPVSKQHRFVFSVWTKDLRVSASFLCPENRFGKYIVDGYSINIWFCSPIDVLRIYIYMLNDNVSDKT